MSGRYESYLEYKNTGIDWLPTVPVDWQVLPLKLASANKVKDGPHETPKFLDEGIPFFSVDGIQDCKLVFEGCRYISPEDHERFSMKCLPKFGDVLLGKAASVGKVAFVDTKEEFNVWSPLAVLTPKSVKLGRFIFYSLQSTWLQAQCDVNSNSNTQKNLSMGVIDNLLFAIPSDDVAEKIANFLDHETAKIDTLIEKQQQLIALLKEKRQAVISHAVTKGLHPNAPMKNSGVEWLGDVPEHWLVSNMNYVLEAIGDVDHYMPKSVDSGIPYVMTGDLKESASNIDFDTCKQVNYDDYLNLSKKIRTSKGDVIMARYATIGTVSYVDIDANFLVSYSCVTIKPDLSKVVGLYLYYYFKSDAFLQGIQNQVNTNTQGNVGVGDLKKLKVALPPAAEQEKVIKYLQSKMSKLDSIANRAKEAIKLIQERRTALISAAVTGKIDVRNWSAD